MQSAHRHGSRTWERQHWVCEVAFSYQSLSGSTFLSCDNYKIKEKRIFSLFCSESLSWEGQFFLVRQRRSSSSCGVIHWGTSKRQWCPGQVPYLTKCSNSYMKEIGSTEEYLAGQVNHKADKSKAKGRDCTESTSERPQDPVMTPTWVTLTWKLLSSNGITSGRTTQRFPNTQPGVLRGQLKSPLVSSCTIILLYLHVVCTRNIASWNVTWLKATCAVVFAFGK